MAIIFVVYMTVWKTFFALYMINNMHHAEKTPWLTFGVLFNRSDIKAGILNIHC